MEKVSRKGIQMRSRYQEKEMVLNGIVISVVKKPIKNMYIRIVPPDGRVQITAPYIVSDDLIRSFAVSKMAWIEKQQNYFRERQEPAGREYKTGESCYLWGRRYVLDVRETDEGIRVYPDGEKLVLQTGRQSTSAQREHVLNEWYREQIKRAVPDVLRKCEGIVGVQAREWRIKNMRTRWGTCNVQKKRIWLNLQLAQMTPECLEYVIVHELVHLLERNHNARFYAYMDRFYPGWMAVRADLNRQAQELLTNV